MVRTYAFNPSTQESGQFMAGTFKYPHQKGMASMPAPKSLHPPPHPPPLQFSTSIPELPFIDSNPTPHRPPPCPFSTLYKNPPMQSSLDSSGDSSGIGGFGGGRLNREVSDEQTTIVGIRSVVIDGQRFYQPVDAEVNEMLNEQFASIHNSHRRRSHSMDTPKREEVAAMFGAMAAAPRPREHLKSPHFGSLQRTPSYRDQPSTRTTDGFESKEMIEDSLPWARGTLQPRNGVRGSGGWQLGQQKFGAGNSYNGAGLNEVLKPFNTSSPQFDSSFATFTKKPSNIYQTASQEAYSYAPRPVDYPLNPASSFHTFTVDPPAFTSPILFGGTPEDHRRYEKEQHRMDLLRQIEDNQRRKQMEKHNEWVEEERDRWRSELTLQRQRAEVEREQDEVRQRQLAAERKAQQAAFEIPAEKPSGRRHDRERGRRRSQENTTPPKRQSVDAGPQLEWWEKKPSWEQRNQSPALPTFRERRRSNPSRASRISRQESLAGSELISASRAGVPDGFERPGSFPSRQSRSQSRSSRRSYQPSIASRAGSDTSGLRRLSATRRNLQSELERVRSAVDKNKYDERVFDTHHRS